MAESKKITPGIYHTVLPMVGEPDLKRHREWCKAEGREPNLRPIDELLEEILSIHKRGVFGMPEFFGTVDRFLEAWMNGYKTGEHGVKLHHRTKGFQLEYVDWDENSPLYRIGAWEGLNLFGDVESIIIATDLNGLVDSRDYMSLGINDFGNQRVLAYKPREELSNFRLVDSWKEKGLMEDEPVYLGVGGESFPFKSRNPNKSAPYTWLMVGLQPQDVYDGFRALGFVFQEPGQH